MRLVAVVLAGVLLSGVGLSLAFAGEGSITFSDQAPPPTEEDKKRGEQLAFDAKKDFERAYSLGKALRAVDSLKGELSLWNRSRQIDNELATSIGLRMGALNVWLKLFDRRFDKGTKMEWGVDDQDFVFTMAEDFRESSIQMLTELQQHEPSKEGSVIDFTVFLNNLTQVRGWLVRGFDYSVLSHGLKNLRLSKYPYAGLVAQPFMDCNLINTYSKDFRCLPPDSTDQMIDKTQFCRTYSFENFSQTEQGNRNTWVRKDSTIGKDSVRLQC